MTKHYGDWKRGTITIKSFKDEIMIYDGEDSVGIPLDFWHEIVRDFTKLKMNKPSGNPPMPRRGK